MFRRYFKEVEKLLGSACPAFIVEIRLVPDFPVNNASVMTVCPALVHVADNMLSQMTSQFLKSFGGMIP